MAQLAIDSLRASVSGIFGVRFHNGRTAATSATTAFGNLYPHTAFSLSAGSEDADAICFTITCHPDSCDDVIWLLANAGATTVNALDNSNWTK